MEKSKSRGALVVALGNTRLLPPLQQQLLGKRQEQILKPTLSYWLLCPAPNEASWARQHRPACSDGKHVSMGSWCVGSPARRETSFFATRKKKMEYRLREISTRGPIFHCIVSPALSEHTSDTVRKLNCVSGKENPTCRQMGVRRGDVHLTKSSATGYV